MKPTTYHHRFIVPLVPHAEPWLTARNTFPYLTLEELFISFFSNLAFMREEGWVIGRDDGMPESERFNKALHMLVTLMSSDLEGSGEVPREFDLEEIGALHEFAKRLLWELWMCVAEGCWQHATLAFIRLLPDGILIGYHGEQPYAARAHTPFLPDRLQEF